MDANLKSHLRQEAHETLINIAGVSKRLHAELARANINLKLVSTRTCLDKIVVASKSILAKSLVDDSFLDPRLEDWLCGKEPNMCLHILSDMERLIATDLGAGTLWGKVSGAVHSVYPEGRINEAVKLFNDRQEFFHFLLTPEVWNYETADRSQPVTVLGVVPQICQSDMVLAQAHNDIFRTWGQHGRNKGSPDKQKNEELDSKKLDSVLERLDGFSCNQKHEDVFSLRQHGTCKWLPETDQYKAWRNSNNSFLWLQGKAGAGKTVLAASVIDGITGTLQDGESLVFFYCDFRDERTTSAAAAMCSVLSQLLRKLHNGTGRDLIQLVNDIENRLTEGTLVKHARSIVPFVSRAARQFRQQPFLVLDALDECQDVENLLTALRELTKGGMRPFVTSRPLHNIKDKFRDLSSISMDNMEEEVSADIGLHITKEIDSNLRLRRLEGKVKMEILYMLRDKADGMFRWVQCQIDTLKKCATTRDIRTALRSLPSGLDETYERILCAIDLQSSDGKLALRALVWLVAALRPLQLAEIFEGLSVDLRGRRLDREIAPVHEYALLDALGSLVVYDEEADVIKLSHFSVKEYLIRTPTLTKFSAYRIDIQIAHAQVALLCMCYITAVIKHWALFEAEMPPQMPPQVPSDERMDIILSKSHPLLHYAFSHGFRHLQCLEFGNGAAIDGMIALRLDIERHPIQWQRMCALATLSLGLPYLSGLTAQHDFITCVLVSLLPEPFLRAFLYRAPFKALDGTSPLIYATYFGKVEHARTLLSRGVSHVNCTGLDVERPRQVLPLEAAFHYRHRPLFDLFLSHPRVTVPLRLFSSVFYEGYLVYTPRDSTMLLRYDEFAEWVTDGQHGKSLLHTLDDDLRLVMQSASEEVVLILLRRLAQAGCDFSGPDSLESVLRVMLCAASQRSLSVLLYLHSLDVPIPSRALLVGRMPLVEGLTLRGLDVHATSTQGDITLHRAFGECKHGSSCWAPDCNLCSVFLRVMGPQTKPHAPIDVLLVGRKGAGKSSLVNMILGIPDNLPGAAQVSDGGTLQITSYATLLGSLPAQIWDTPGFDQTLEGHHIKGRFDDWLLQVSSSHLEQPLNVETDHLDLNFNLKLPIIQVVWCMHAEEISDPATWQQFQAIYGECSRRSELTFMVLVNQVSVQSPANWEVQCQDQLQMLGLSASESGLKSVRRHSGVSSPEYGEDAQTLSRLIRQHAPQNHRGIEVIPTSPHSGDLVTSFRCGWVTVLSAHFESICDCIVRSSDLPDHLRECHSIGNLSGATLTCRWGGCNQCMQGWNIVRHVRALHLPLRYVCPDCSRPFSHPGVLQTYMRRCSSHRQTPHLEFEL